MIHYHGGPITPVDAARSIWTGRHAMISFAYPDQVALAAEVCQSFVLDNGAFSLWGKGRSVDVDAYWDWVREWCDHPGFDWCLIPDRIDGDEGDNRALVEDWSYIPRRSVPVWHLHESFDYLRWLMARFDRVALGSSGEWPNPGEPKWWDRMNEAMGVVCLSDGRPRVRLHGLRMLDPTIFSALPLASADSCNVARNIGIDQRWERGYLAGISKGMRAQVMAHRIEQHASASTWTRRDRQMNFELLG